MADKSRESSLAGLEPDDVWAQAYDVTETSDGREEPFSTLAVVMGYVEDSSWSKRVIKRVRKDFERAERLVGQQVAPHLDDNGPLTVSAREVELAYHILVKWVLRLASERSQRLLLLIPRMQRLRKATLQVFPVYASALEKAATEVDSFNAWHLGRKLNSVPRRTVAALAGCMTDMERSFAGAGVFACVEALADKPHDLDKAFDWSFQDPYAADDRRPRRSALAYARTLGSRSFRRKMDAILGEETTRRVLDGYDDAMVARKFQARVAAACRQHGASLCDSPEEMAGVVASHPYKPPRATADHGYLKRSKTTRSHVFQQAVEDRIAASLCNEVEPESQS